MTMLAKWALASAALFVLIAAWSWVQRRAARLAGLTPGCEAKRTTGCGCCGSACTPNPSSKPDSEDLP